MKRIFQTFRLSLPSVRRALLTFLPALGVGVSASVAANLVKNGSFETVRDGEISHWENNLDADHQDLSRARSGEASLRIGGKGEAVYCNVNPAPQLEPDTEYTLRYWVDAREVAGAHDSYVRFRLVDLDNSRIDAFGHENAWSHARRTREWILIEHHFRTADDFGNARLDLMWDLKSGDTAWVDDVALVRRGEHASASELLLLTKVEELASDGRGISVVECRVADRYGNPVADAEGTVRLGLEGAGQILNGGTQQVMEGSAFFHLQGGGATGDSAAVTAEFEGMQGGPVRLRMIEPSRAETPEHFRYGFFEDGNMVWETHAYRAMLETIRAASDHFNIMILTNGGTDRTTPLFSISDEMGFDLFMYPPRDIFYTWFDNPDIEHSLEKAMEIAGPVVEAWKDQPRNLGYYTIDEPTWDKLPTTATITEAFRRLDPEKPVAAVSANGDRVPHMFDMTRPDILLIDPYPVRGNTTVGSWTATFAEDIRSQSRTLPAGYPLWTILQCHGSENPAFSGAAVRTPEAEEVRAQFWIALGEGSRCITWFIFKTQQFWTGVEDNPAVFEETSDLAERLENIKAILPRLWKIEDRFQVESTGPRPYVSTLFDKKRGNFVVIQNGDCENRQRLRVRSVRAGNRGILTDLETGKEYRLGEAIELRPGDGKLFKYDFQ